MKFSNNIIFFVFLYICGIYLPQLAADDKGNGLGIRVPHLSLQNKAEKFGQIAFNHLLPSEPNGRKPEKLSDVSSFIETTTRKEQLKSFDEKAASSTPIGPLDDNAVIIDLSDFTSPLSKETLYEEILSTLSSQEYSPKEHKLHLDVKPPKHSSTSFVKSFIAVLKSVTNHLFPDETLGAKTKNFRNNNGDLLDLKVTLYAKTPKKEPLEKGIQLLTTSTTETAAVHEEPLESVLTRLLEQSTKLEEGNATTLFLQTTLNCNDEKQGESIIRTTLEKFLPSVDSQITPKLLKEVEGGKCRTEFDIRIKPKNTHLKILNLAEPDIDRSNEIKEALKEIVEDVKNNVSKAVTFDLGVILPLDESRNSVEEIVDKTKGILHDELPHIRIFIESKQTKVNDFPLLELRITVAPSKKQQSDVGMKRVKIDLTNPNSDAARELVEIFQNILKTVRESAKPVSLILNITLPNEINMDSLRQELYTLITVLTKDVPSGASIGDIIIQLTFVPRTNKGEESEETEIPIETTVGSEEYSSSIAAQVENKAGVKDEVPMQTNVLFSILQGVSNLLNSIGNFLSQLFGKTSDTNGVVAVNRDNESTEQSTVSEEVKTNQNLHDTTTEENFENKEKVITTTENLLPESHLTEKDRGDKIIEEPPKIFLRNFAPESISPILENKKKNMKKAENEQNTNESIFEVSTHSDEVLSSDDHKDLEEKYPEEKYDTEKKLVPKKLVQHDKKPTKLQRFLDWIKQKVPKIPRKLIPKNSLDHEKKDSSIDLTPELTTTLSNKNEDLADTVETSVPAEVLSPTENFNTHPTLKDENTDEDTLPDTQNGIQTSLDTTTQQNFLRTEATTFGETNNPDYESFESKEKNIVEPQIPEVQKIFNPIIQRSFSINAEEQGHEKENQDAESTPRLDVEVTSSTINDHLEQLNNNLDNYGEHDVMETTKKNLPTRENFPGDRYDRPRISKGDPIEDNLSGEPEIEKLKKPDLASDEGKESKKPEKPDHHRHQQESEDHPNENGDKDKNLESYLKANTPENFPGDRYDRPRILKGNPIEDNLLGEREIEKLEKSDLASEERKESGKPEKPDHHRHQQESEDHPNEDGDEDKNLESYLKANTPEVSREEIKTLLSNFNNLKKHEELLDRHLDLARNEWNKVPGDYTKKNKRELDAENEETLKGREEKLKNNAEDVTTAFWKEERVPTDYSSLDDQRTTTKSIKSSREYVTLQEDKYILTTQQPASLNIEETPLSALEAIGTKAPETTNADIISPKSNDNFGKSEKSNIYSGLIPKEYLFPRTRIKQEKPYTQNYHGGVEKSRKNDDSNVLSDENPERYKKNYSMKKDKKPSTAFIPRRRSLDIKNGRSKYSTRNPHPKKGGKQPKLRKKYNGRENLNKRLKTREKKSSKPLRLHDNRYGKHGKLGKNHKKHYGERVTNKPIHRNEKRKNSPYLNHPKYFKKHVQPIPKERKHPTYFSQDRKPKNISKPKRYHTEDANVKGKDGKRQEDEDYFPLSSTKTEEYEKDKPKVLKKVTDFPEEKGDEKKVKNKEEKRHGLEDLLLYLSKKKHERNLERENNPKHETKPKEGLEREKIGEELNSKPRGLKIPLFENQAINDRNKAQEESKIEKPALRFADEEQPEAIRKLGGHDNSKPVTDEQELTTNADIEDRKILEEKEISELNPLSSIGDIKKHDTTPDTEEQNKHNEEKHQAQKEKKILNPFENITNDLRNKYIGEKKENGKIRASSTEKENKEKNPGAKENEEELERIHEREAKIENEENDAVTERYLTSASKERQGEKKNPEAEENEELERIHERKAKIENEENDAVTERYLTSAGLEGRKWRKRRPSNHQKNKLESSEEEESDETNEATAEIGNENDVIHHKKYPLSYQTAEQLKDEGIDPKNLKQSSGPSENPKSAEIRREKDVGETINTETPKVVSHIEDILKAFDKDEKGEEGTKKKLALQKYLKPSAIEEYDKSKRPEHQRKTEEEQEEEQFMKKNASPYYRDEENNKKPGENNENIREETIKLLTNEQKDERREQPKEILTARNLPSQVFHKGDNHEKYNRVPEVINHSGVEGEHEGVPEIKLKAGESSILKNEEFESNEDKVLDNQDQVEKERPLLEQISTTESILEEAQTKSTEIPEDIFEISTGNTITKGPLYQFEETTELPITEGTEIQNTPSSTSTTTEQNKVLDLGHLNLQELQDLTAALENLVNDLKQEPKNDVELQLVEVPVTALNIDWDKIENYIKEKLSSIVNHTLTVDQQNNLRRNSLQLNFTVKKPEGADQDFQKDFTESVKNILQNIMGPEYVDVKSESIPENENQFKIGVTLQPTELSIETPTLCLDDITVPQLQKEISNTLRKALHSAKSSDKPVSAITIHLDFTTRKLKSSHIKKLNELIQKILKDLNINGVVLSEEDDLKLKNNDEMKLDIPIRIDASHRNLNTIDRYKEKLRRKMEMKELEAPVLTVSDLILAT